MGLFKKNSNDDYPYPMNKDFRKQDIKLLLYMMAVCILAVVLFVYIGILAYNS